MIEITEQMLDAYMDGYDSEWRDHGPEMAQQIRGWVRNGLAAVAPLMVAAEREACAQISEQFSGMKWAAYDMATGVFPKQSRMEIAIASAIRARGDRP